MCLIPTIPMVPHTSQSMHYCQRCGYYKDIYRIWKVCAQGDLERPLALSGMSYKWLSHRGIHPSSGPIIQSPKEDSFLASFTESLNILSRMSRFSVRYSIR